MSKMFLEYKEMSGPSQRKSQVSKSDRLAKVIGLVKASLTKENHQKNMQKRGVRDPGMFKQEQTGLSKLAALRNWKAKAVW